MQLFLLRSIGAGVARINPENCGSISKIVTNARKRRAARYARYHGNYTALVEGMSRLGFRVFLDSAIQAPIIVTFHAPPDPNYAFPDFYNRVRDKGFVLYPGKLTQVETFRVGCIGAIGPEQMRHAVNAVRDTLAEMGITEVAPAPARRAAA